MESEKIWSVGGVRVAAWFDRNPEKNNKIDEKKMKLVSGFNLSGIEAGN